MLATCRQLERDLLEVAGRGAHDRLAGRHAAGKRDFVDQRARGKRRADRRAAAGNDADDAVRKPASSIKRASHSAVSGVNSDGLRTDVARSERRRHLPSRHQQRKVPWDELTAHANRFAHDERLRLRRVRRTFRRAVWSRVPRSSGSNLRRR